MARSRGHGFSLIELMVALAILTVGIYALADLLIASRRTARNGDDRIAATALGRMKMREIQVAGEQVAVLLADRPDVLVPAEGPASFAENPRLRWQATLTRDAESSRTIQVAVAVSGTAGAVTRVDGLVLLPATGPAQEGGAI
jgi:prepilin-type N-terminal cleavage/methylation domain-containing protein